MNHLKEVQDYWNLRSAGFSDAVNEELDSPLGYPAVIVLSIAIIIGMLVFFKKKKWL